MPPNRLEGGSNRKGDGEHDPNGRLRPASLTLYRASALSRNRNILRGFSCAQPTIIKVSSLSSRDYAASFLQTRPNNISVVFTRIDFPGLWMRGSHYVTAALQA
jgi:hypothetical protein